MPTLPEQEIPPQSEPVHDSYTAAARAVLSQTGIVIPVYFPVEGDNAVGYRLLRETVAACKAHMADATCLCLSVAGAAHGGEIAEELGIEGPTPEAICQYLYLGPLNRSLVAVYKVTWDGEIRHQPEEVEWGSYMSIEELESKTAEWNFVPDGLEIWHHLRQLKAI